MKKVLIILFLPLISLAQNGWNMNLLGTYDYNTTSSDIWGWADANGNEFALVGLNNGFSVADVTVPSNPVQTFFIADISSTWRDIKTWGNYAYVTTEADAGLLIVDLSDVTGNTYWHLTQFTNPNGGFVEFTAAHNIYIDENGIAYIFGASSNTGSSPPNGAIFLDVNTNPTNPVYLGNWNDQYIHDGMVRGDTMYAGCIYTGKLYVVDVSNKANPATLGNAFTPNTFTHNAWVSDDGNYVFTTDEQSDAYLAAYDITNVNNIQEVDRIQSNPGSNAIPHNTHVDGNFLITSYYRDGTTVHDITYPNNMIQVAYYDSYPGSGNGFDGCWGTYPFLPSGNIISSDRNSNNGLGQLLIFGRAFQQACYLQGVITDCQTGNTIPNATIEILTTPINEVANLAGAYQTALVDSGTYQIVYAANGYENDTLAVTLINGVMTTQNVVLCPPCSTFSISSNNIAAICDDDTYSIGNSNYSVSGTYIDAFASSFGCDSLVYTYLTVYPTSTISMYDTICTGQSIVVGNNVYNQSGVYTDILNTISGCDSTITTYLFVQDTINTTQNSTICNGDSIWVGPNYYTQTGVYTDVFNAQNGCDSIVTTNLDVLQHATYTNTQTICNGDGISVGQSYYDTTGNYIDILVATNGCDSTIYTNLTVAPSYSIVNQISICSGDSVLIGGAAYYTSGIYTENLLTNFSCDSIINTHLIVSAPLSQLYASNNQLHAVANSGTLPYTYEVYGPNGLILSSVNNMGTTLSVNPTVNGSYYFIATDALGCTTDTAFVLIDFASGVIENTANKKVVKITNVLGQETMYKKNTPLFYIYDDGTVEKVIIID